MKPFIGKVEIGKTYLDTWGRIHIIGGYVVIQRGWASQPDTVDKSKVYSSGGNHFNINTGRGVHNTPQLVQLPKDDELQFWKDRLTQIRSVNCIDKLKLVAEELERMEQRIKELQ